MPWAARAKDLMGHVLRTGRLPGTTPDPDAEADAESGLNPDEEPDGDLEPPPA